MELINELILRAVESPWLPLVMFAVAVIDGFFPPIPSEVVLVAAAAVAGPAGDVPTLLLLGAAAVVGATIGDNIAYALGRRIGTDRLGRMRGRRFSAAIERAHNTLQRRAAPLILGARYIPVGRVAVNMSAGALGFPWRRFLPLSVIAATSWTVYSVVIGVLAGRWLEDQPLFSAVIGIVFALIVGVAIERVAELRRGRVATAPPGDGARGAIPAAPATGTCAAPEPAGLGEWR